MRVLFELDIELWELRGAWGTWSSEQLQGEWFMLICGSIGCALAMKIGVEAKEHEISKTQKSFGEILPG